MKNRGKVFPLYQILCTFSLFERTFMYQLANEFALKLWKTVPSVSNPLHFSLSERTFTNLPNNKICRKPFSKYQVIYKSRRNCSNYIKSFAFLLFERIFKKLDWQEGLLMLWETVLRVSNHF